MRCVRASTEVSFVVPPTNLPSLIGTWAGTITNHVPRPSGRLITGFTLQLNANPPFAGSTFGRFTSTFCNHTLLAGFYVTSTGAPAVSMESMSCTDGDFGLIVETLSATTAEGRCSLGGPDCRFQHDPTLRNSCIRCKASSSDSVKARPRGRGPAKPSVCCKRPSTTFRLAQPSICSRHSIGIA